MNTTTVPDVEVSSTGGVGDELDHIYCACDENRALCGRDVTDEPIQALNPDKTCVVCLDLGDVPCERCGS